MHNYIGRFAPSPTGPLHFGSLITAVASYLDARKNGGKWLVRMEDLDPPREIPGAADQILTTLDLYGLHWDDSVVYQSHRHEQYEAIVQSLLSNQQAFYCTCSRKQLTAEQNRQGISAYPGTCRSQHTSPDEPSAIRLRVTEGEYCFQDHLQDRYCQNIEREIGDFIIKRKDALYAYHLAVVIDDHWQGISHIVRGIDLLDNTPRQCYLMQRLGFTQPQYAHLPIVVNEKGQKLSKQSFAKAINSTDRNRILWTAFSVLGLEPEQRLQQEPPETMLQWATQAWDMQKLKRQSCISSTTIPFDV